MAAGVYSKDASIKLSTVGPPAIPQREPVPFTLRCGAILIDYIVIAGVIAFSTIISRELGGGARVAGGRAQLAGIGIAAFLFVVDFAFMAGFTGRTIGKWATGLMIEREDGRRAGFARIVVRHFIGYPVSALTFGLGFLFALFSVRGRALHDIIAGTLVVREREIRRAPVRR